MTAESGFSDGLSTQDLEEIHQELRGLARNILKGRKGQAALSWSELVDLGWLGLEVPDELGGAGVGFEATGLILTEMGRAAAASAYFGSVVLAVGILRTIEPGEIRDDLLERLAAGMIRSTAVVPSADDAVGDSLVPFRLSRSSDDLLVLDGTAAFVPDASEADVLIVVAIAPTSELVAIVVERGNDRLQVVSQPVLDSTRTFASVSADSLGVPRDSVLRFSNPDSALREILDRGAAAIACDSLGIISAMLDETVSYTSTRKQFGRAIGSFQAVKHACADMYVALQVSSELVGACVSHIAIRDEGTSTAVSMAKSHVTEAAVEIAGKAVQLHGGIGYTWEAGLHIYQKRALLNRSLFGSPDAHRRRLGARYK